MFILPTGECIQFSLSKEVSAATLLGWQIKLMPKGLTWDKLLHPRQGLFTFPCPGPFTHKLIGNGTGASSTEATNIHWEREKNCPCFLNQKEFFFFLITGAY